MCVCACVCVRVCECVCVLLDTLVSLGTVRTSTVARIVTLGLEIRNKGYTLNLAASACMRDAANFGG